ncbi:MAG: hypothetical protein KDD44_05550 [Bdellovibrionales bacterium]|nr:hypothetical protein [Bdellovibrionales bacterium]
MFSRSQFRLILLGSILLCDVAVAESPASTGSQASENYSKTEQFLPGEEVVTPTGQRMRVWSTRGPVRVSPPPQPFDDPEKQSLSGSGVLVDERNDVRKEGDEDEGFHRHQ